MKTKNDCESERIAKSVSSAAGRRHTRAMQIVSKRHTAGDPVLGQDEPDIVRRQHVRLRRRQKGRTHTAVRNRTCQLYCSATVH